MNRIVVRIITTAGLAIVSCGGQPAIDEDEMVYCVSKADVTERILLQELWQEYSAIYNENPRTSAYQQPTQRELDALKSMAAVGLDAGRIDLDIVRDVLDGKVTHADCKRDQGMVSMTMGDYWDWQANGIGYGGIPAKYKPDDTWTFSIPVTREPHSSGPNPIRNVYRDDGVTTLGEKAAQECPPPATHWDWYVDEGNKVQIECYYR